MSVYFIGDPHLDHKNIAKFRPWVKSTEENTALFLSEWHRVIRKRDDVYMMGDVAFSQEALDLVGNLPGRKILIKGNHDDYVSTSAQAAVFHEIHGMLKYKGMWLTHCPIHPDEMRNRKCNIHGHVHNATVMKGFGPWRKPDPRYINTCVDVLWPQRNSFFISLDEIRKMTGE